VCRAAHVENQAVRFWIERIEFIESEKTLGKGEGGKNEDDEYFDLLPNI
jgi:methionine sulfoxide reductase catalytic subunit